MRNGGGGRGGGEQMLISQDSHTSSWTSSRSIFQRCTQNCFTLILHIYLPKLCSQWRREQDRSEGSGGCWQRPGLTDTCSLNRKKRVQWASTLVAVGKEHTPAFSILPLAEVLLLKSKLTEVYANDPEASKKLLILLPRVSQDFPGGSDSKSICLQCRRPEFNPWVGKIPWRRKWQPISVFLPENSMDGGAWQATAHGVAKSRTRLSDFTSLQSQSKSQKSLCSVLEDSIQNKHGSVF